MTRVADYTEELCESQRMHLKLVQNANRGYHLQLPLDAAMKRQSIQLADAFICVSSCQSVINISSITTSEAGQDRRRRRRSLSSGDWLPSIGDAGHAYEIYNWRTLLKVNGFLNFFRWRSIQISCHSPRTNCCSMMNACGSCRTESSRLRTGLFVLCWLDVFHLCPVVHYLSRFFSRHGKSSMECSCALYPAIIWNGFLLNPGISRYIWIVNQCS